MNNPKKTEVKKLFFLGLGAGLSQLCQVLVNLTDSIMMGKESTDGLAAGLLASSIYNLGLLFCMGIIVTITIILGNVKHNDDIENERAIVTNTAIMAFALAIIMCVFLVVAIIVLSCTYQDSSMLKYAKAYLKGLIPGVLPWILFLMLRNVLTCYELVKLTTLISIGSVFADVLLNQIFMWGLWDFHGYGIIGSAYSTSLVNWLSFVICLIGIFVGKNERIKKVIKPKLRLKKETFRQLVIFGLPTGLIFFSEYLIFTAGNALLSRYSSDAVVAFGVSTSWLNLFYMFPVGISQILTVKIADYVAVKNKSAIAFITKSAVVITLIYNTLIVVFILFAKQFLIYSIVDSSVISSHGYYLSEIYLYIICPITFFYNLMVVFAGILRGFSDVKTPIIMVVIMYWILGVGGSLLLSKFLNEYGVLVGMLIGFVLTFAGMLQTYLQKMKKEFIEEVG